MRILSLIIVALSAGSFANGQETVCGLFKDLPASNGRTLILSGDLLISKDVAMLGAADCEEEYVVQMYRMPTALQLRPSAKVPQDQLQQWKDASAKADRLRREGRVVEASASFFGTLRVNKSGNVAGELTFDAIEGLRVEALPDASELPVIPICDLFQDLTNWKGKRIAVRGQGSGTFEGTWLSSPCQGGLVSDGYRWPVAITYGGPAYYSRETASLYKPKKDGGPVKGEQEFRGRNTVTRTETWIGRLRVRDEYFAVCNNGTYWGNGYGHLNAAAAELVVEEVRDVELSRRVAVEGDTEESSTRCEPPERAELCSLVRSIEEAARGGCVAKVHEILARDGIDSKDGNASAALSAAINTENEPLVRLLLESGAPVNPTKFSLWPPLTEAAQTRNTGIVKLLLAKGADVNGKDSQGATYLPSSGFFSPGIMMVFLDAGANPDAQDKNGRTALMGASGYGYEDTVRLLLDQKAGVDVRDKSGRTALMHAAAGKYVDAIPLLLAKGADVRAKDLEGKTALDIARASKNQVAIEMLTEAMNAH